MAALTTLAYISGSASSLDEVVEDAYASLEGNTERPLDTVIDWIRS